MINYMAEINEDYIRERFGEDLLPENVVALKGAMEKYGDNHWWESKDPIEIAMYQIFEDILMAEFSKFHEGLEKLLGRPVFTHELGLDIRGLREEAKLGIKRLKRGIGTSDEYKETAVRRSIEMLEDYCRRTGKQFLKVDMDEGSERDENGIDQTGYDGWL